LPDGLRQEGTAVAGGDIASDNREVEPDIKELFAEAVRDLEKRIR
jgi:hypothetical protein